MIFSIRNFKNGTKSTLFGENIQWSGEQGLKHQGWVLPYMAIIQPYTVYGLTGYGFQRFLSLTRALGSSFFVLNGVSFHYMA